MNKQHCSHKKMRLWLVPVVGYPLPYKAAGYTAKQAADATEKLFGVEVIREGVRECK